MNVIRRLITVIRTLFVQTHVALTNALAAKDMLETVLLVTDTQVRFFLLVFVRQVSATGFVECSFHPSQNRDI